MSCDKKCMHKTSIGGQAVLEGVMMRGPEKVAVCVRKSNGEIVSDVENLKGGKKWYSKVPLLRGCINFFSSMILGVRTLMKSADMYDLEEEDPSYKPSKADEVVEKVFKTKDAVIYFSVVIALVFSIGLFFLLPGFISDYVIKKFITQNPALISVCEGVVRILIFLAYLLLVTLNKDIQRVFQYHGAEHKTISAYEHGEELTPENVRKHSRFHPRCGTSFLVFVMLISIVLFAFIPQKIGGVELNGILRIVFRLALLPVVAGISYEIIKWAGRSENVVVKALSKPGMMLQYLTTREPDDSQIEVAIASISAVIPENREDDKW